MSWSRLAGVLRRLLLVLVLLALACLLAGAAVVGVGSRERLAPADLGVVLGTWSYPDGRPSAGLEARCDRAVEIYRAGLVPWLMVTGRTDWHGGNEAVSMRDYLVGAGVPAEIIVVDTLGMDTWRSALHAKAWLEARGLKRAMIVTQAFHVPRARLAFARVGGLEMSWTHARFSERSDWFAVGRELAGFVKYLLGPIPARL